MRRIPIGRLAQSLIGRPRCLTHPSHARLQIRLNDVSTNQFSALILWDRLSTLLETSLFVRERVAGVLYITAIVSFADHHTACSFESHGRNWQLKVGSNRA